MNIETYEKKFLIHLLKSYFDGDKAAKIIFESADFRQCIKSMTERFNIESNNINLGRNECEPNPENIVHLIVNGPEASADQIKNVRVWLKDAKHVTICDPYFFNGKSGSHKSIHKSDFDYIENISSILPNTATSLNIYTYKMKKSVRDKMVRRLKNGRNVRVYYTREIHDRYIIKDHEEGKMFGTSFGGFGGKLFTVLDLPKRDTETLVELLSSITNTTPLP